MSPVFPPNVPEQSPSSPISSSSRAVVSGAENGEAGLKSTQFKGSKSMQKHVFKLIVGTTLALAFVTGAQAGSANGSASVIPAYYDGNLFNIHFVEFSPAAERALLQHNSSLNFIYQSDPGLPGDQPFVSVIDAIPGDGFNPIWEEVQISFTAGHTPRQLFSDTEVEAAFDAGEITLTF